MPLLPNHWLMLIPFDPPTPVKLPNLALVGWVSAVGPDFFNLEVQSPDILMGGTDHWDGYLFRMIGEDKAKRESDGHIFTIGKQVSREMREPRFGGNGPERKPN